MTIAQDALTAVRGFFASVGMAGLILPSGWFGRPYDNLLRLTHSEVTSGLLRLELEGQLVLTFSGDARATTTATGLRLTGYSGLAWDWIEFGSATRHHEKFTGGQVEFVGAVG